MKTFFPQILDHLSRQNLSSKLSITFSLCVFPFYRRKTCLNQVSIAAIIYPLWPRCSLYQLIAFAMLYYHSHDDFFYVGVTTSIVAMLARETIGFFLSLQFLQVFIFLPFNFTSSLPFFLHKTKVKLTRNN